MFSRCLGSYELYHDVEYEPFICHNANVFKKVGESVYLYMSKYGNWVIGNIIMMSYKHVIAKLNSNFNFN